VRVLNGSSIAGLGALYEVDLDRYCTIYTATHSAPTVILSLRWSTPPVNPGGGTTLTGITLTKSEWTVGTPGANFIIAFPKAQRCPRAPSVRWCAGLYLHDSTQCHHGLVSINTAAAQQLAQAHTFYTINCGGKTETFTIHQVGTTTTATVEEVVESNGTMTLKLKITRPAAEVVAGAKASYWVGAVIPGSALFSQEDEWFYLSTAPRRPRMTGSS
jgi:hypothetical protein